MLGTRAWKLNCSPGENSNAGGIWRMANRLPQVFVLAARQPIGAENVILLIDGNRCHDRAGHACLIRYGTRWRNAAAAALTALGLQPPASAA